MDKAFRKKIKKKLIQDKKKLTKELSSFARKDPKIKGNWMTRFPFFGTDRSHKDESAEEIERYENLLPVEHTLELRLKKIEKALERVEESDFGKCQDCNKKIRKIRLEIVPEADLCSVCGRSKDRK